MLQQTSYPYIYSGAAILLAIAGLVLWFLHSKGRPFAPGDVFRASRWSASNRLFPTQVLITSSNVVHYTPQWIGKLEHSIHIAHVASVKIDTKVFFSDVYIETSGGASPISCYGHHKKDAIRIKQLIERYQSEYFRAPSAAKAANAPRAEPGGAP
jgi:hypothetical protein